MQNTRVLRVAGTLVLLSFSLGGCATSMTGSSVMDARAEAAAPQKPGAYLPVEEMPPDRTQPALTADEQLKLKKELIAAREAQAKNKAKADDARAEPAKP
jgi:hypothetical protein